MSRFPVRPDVTAGKEKMAFLLTCFREKVK